MHGLGGGGVSEIKNGLIAVARGTFTSWRSISLNRIVNRHEFIDKADKGGRGGRVKRNCVANETSRDILMIIGPLYNMVTWYKITHAFWDTSCTVWLKNTLMSRNAGSGENGNFGEILSVNLTIFMQITLTEMDLTCWRIWRIWRFLCKLHVGEFEDHQRWA